MAKENWVSRLKRRPRIAAILLISTTVAGLLAWATGVIENGQKMLKFVGLDSAAQIDRRKTILNSYELGKEVADVSYIQFRRRKNPEVFTPNVERVYKSNVTAAEARATALGLAKFDIQSLNFVPLTHDDVWSQTETQAIRSISGLISANKGEEMATAFRTGFHQQLYFRRVFANDFVARAAPALSFDQEIEIDLDRSLAVGFPKYIRPDRHKRDPRIAYEYLVTESLSSFDKAVRHKFGW
jgi:hypothetical protein